MAANWMITMVKIKRFTLNTQQAQLNIEFEESNKHLSILSYEFIRVFSPLDGMNSKRAKEVVSHKKQIQLLSIESVGQHGYRFIFDDQHSAIYSEQYLSDLNQKQQMLWQQYLIDLKASGHGREATINITQL